MDQVEDALGRRAMARKDQPVKIFATQSREKCTNVALEFARNNVVENDLAQVAQYIVFTTEAEQCISSNGANHAASARIDAQVLVAECANNVAEEANSGAFEAVHFRIWSCNWNV